MLHYYNNKRKNEVQTDEINFILGNHGIRFVEVFIRRPNRRSHQSGIDCRKAFVEDGWIAVRRMHDFILEVILIEKG